MVAGPYHNLGEFQFCNECICLGVCKCFLCSNLNQITTRQIVRNAKKKVATVWDKIKKKVDLTNRKRLDSNWEMIINNYLTRTESPHYRFAEAT